MSSGWQQEQTSPGPDFVPSAQTHPMGVGAPQQPDFALPADPASMPRAAVNPAPPMAAPAPQVFPAQQPYPAQFAPQPPGPPPLQQYQQPPPPGQFQPGMAPMGPPATGQPMMNHPGAPMQYPMQPPGLVPIWVETTPNHPLAITALITAVIFLIYYILLPLSIIPLILGIIARVRISKEPTRWRGKGMATASIVMGGLGTLVSIALIATIIIVG